METPEIHDDEPEITTPASTGLSVASLVLGIASLALCLGPLAGIPAVICGHMALSRIKAEPKKFQGHGMALAGTITGYFGIALIFIAIFAALIVPTIAIVREQARMAECSQNLKRIVTAQISYQIEKDGATVGKESWGELLNREGLPPRAFSCPLQSPQDRGAPENVATWSCYVQIQPVSNASTTGIHPICACPNHGKTLLVVYGDGHVEKLKNTTVEQLQEMGKAEK